MLVQNFVWKLLESSYISGLIHKTWPIYIIGSSLLAIIMSFTATWQLQYFRSFYQEALPLQIPGLNEETAQPE